MVPLGDPRDTTAPFEIDCPARGAGRWIDSRNWSYDFDHDLPAGVRCTFKLRAGLKSIGYSLPDITQILVTHIHRDHYTLAVAIRRLYGTPVSLGAGERFGLDDHNKAINPGAT